VSTRRRPRYLLGVRALALACSVHVVLAALGAAQSPFPADEDVRLEEVDKAFTVSGRVRVPRTASIEALRAISIRGVGDDATLEISGTLNWRAATGGNIELRDVWLEITPECKEITLANCSFRGKGGIRASKNGPSRAKITLEKVEADVGCAVTIEATAGTLLMDGCFLDGPLVVRGVRRSDTVESNLTFAMYGSSGKEQNRVRGLLGGLTIEGVKDGTIRGCDVAGPLALFADNRKLFLDGDNLRAKRVEFRNSASGGFGGIKITKTDFRPEKLVLVSPPQEKSTERLTFDACYFNGLEDLATLRAQMLEDAENSQSAALAVLRDVRAQPHGLAGVEK